MATKIQLRRDTAANWTSANPVLAQGEVGVETDTLKLKLGDGATAWISLPYFGSGYAPATTGSSILKANGAGGFTAAAAGTDYVAPSAIVNNADGTLSVNAANTLEPLSAVTILTTSAAPTIGQTTYYNATSGNLTPTLPALSGLRVGARLAIRRDPTDISSNTVTLRCAGSDTFYSSGATTATLPMMGEQREYQVVSVSGTKYWSPAGSLNSVAALDQRYAPLSTVAKSTKPLVIADNGYSSGVNNISISTAGTGEALFTVGAAATGITAEWEHWYNTGSIDTDPSGSIVFNASLRVVSSTTPGTVTGTIYRMTFGGRTTATLDPGGKIAADVVGISVSPGDVVAVRTFLSSGTAYPGRQTIGGLGTGWGGFTATTDLTAPGSAAVTGAIAWAFGPTSLLGYKTGKTPSVLLVGDSIMAGAYDGFYGISGGLVPNFEWLGGGGAFMRAMSGKAGCISLARLGDMANLFVGTNGSFRRLANAPRCSSALVEYGTNDLYTGGSNATTLQTNLLQIANRLRSLGISVVYLTTLLPRTTSTDGWATTTNQTVGTPEPQRVAHNTWVRAGCPIDPTALTPVAVGTANALTVGQFGHPVNGFFDTAATVESSLNSGFWLPCGRVATGTLSGSTMTSTSANFQTGLQESGGDQGSTFGIFGAGTSGAIAFGYVTVVTSSTQVTYNSSSIIQAVTNAQLNMGVMTLDGTHPSTRGHYLMSQAINPALLT